MATTYLTQNNGMYTGVTYVLDSFGGFSIDQTFQNIQLNKDLLIAKYDVIDAIQIKYSVRKMNEKIGIIKDLINKDKVIEVTSYDYANNNILNSYGNIVRSVTVSSQDFLDNLSTNNIISMGKMSTLYSDFNFTVMKYFGAPPGITSIFKNVNEFSVNKGIFDASAFVFLVNNIIFDGITGSVISPLEGYFTINNLNENLRFICESNIFDNRPKNGYNGNNYTNYNGFMPGDLIYIPNGISITLDIEIEPIDSNAYSNISNVGPLNLNSVNNVINYSIPNKNIHKTTTSSVTHIKQTYSVPILIILDDLDDLNFSNFGNSWHIIPSQYVNGSSQNLERQYWLSISMSSLGQYQTTAEAGGNIYTSNDYGKSWRLSINIGVTDTINNTNSSISVGLSETGLHQTASNGYYIFISNNYGSTWRNVYTLNKTNIYISVSLSGRYQAVLSSGDSIYFSNDYGETWNVLNSSDGTTINGSIYNSIESFPTGCVSMSYTGQHITIAIESIYVSNNYGETWTNIFNDFSDRNWKSVSISSDGLYQTAVEKNGNIYTSKDYGITWNPVIYDNNLINKEWNSVSISAGGNFQIAVEYGGTVYLSSDYGNTWKKSTDTNIQNKKWMDVAISANGQYQTIVEYGGGIYTSSLV
jgi:photosystem II stability/assembly factor-like uncharacterized protein